MATWYARKTANINSVSSGSTSDVWNSAADGSGAWMDTSVLTAGGTDTVLAAHSATTGYTITINIDIDIGTGRLSTAAEGAGYSGGGFTISGSSARTITGSVLAGAGACVECSNTGTGANKVTLNGQVLGSASNAVNPYCWKQTGSGDLAVVYPGGDAVVGGSGSTSAHAITASGQAKNIAVTGNVRGGVATGVFITTAASLTVNGNVVGGTGTSGRGIHLNNVGAAFAVFGDVIGGSGAQGIYCQASTVSSVTGTVFAGAAVNSDGIRSDGGYVVIAGDMLDSLYCTAASGRILWDPSPGVNYRRIYTDGPAAACITLHPDASNVKSGVIAGFDPSGTAVIGTIAQPAVGDVREGVVYGSETGTLEIPAVTDVRDGEQYGAGGMELEGVLEIPAETDVKLGIGYGANGTEFTGLARLLDVSSGTIPPLPVELLQTPVTISTRQGEGAYGPSFSDALISVLCYWENRNKEIQDAKGELRIATAWCAFQPDVAVKTGDRITRDGVVYEVILVESAEPLGVVHHLEVSMTEVV